MEPQTAPSPPKASATELPSNDITSPLQIGDTALVLWRDKTTSLNAKIVERKIHPNANSKSTADKSNHDAVGSDEHPSKKSKTEEENLSADDFLYYVHYTEHDR